GPLALHGPGHRVQGSAIIDAAQPRPAQQDEAAGLGSPGGHQVALPVLAQREIGRAFHGGDHYEVAVSLQVQVGGDAEAAVPVPLRGDLVRLPGRQPGDLIGGFMSCVDQFAAQPAGRLVVCQAVGVDWDFAFLPGPPRVLLEAAEPRWRQFTGDPSARFGWERTREERRPCTVAGGSPEPASQIRVQAQDFAVGVVLAHEPWLCLCAGMSYERTYRSPASI